MLHSDYCKFQDGSGPVWMPPAHELWEFTNLPTTNIVTTIYITINYWKGSASHIPSSSQALWSIVCLSVELLPDLILWYPSNYMMENIWKDAMDAHTTFRCTLTRDQVEMQHSARMNKSVKLHLERHDTQTPNAEEGLVTVSKVSSHFTWSDGQSPVGSIQ